MIVFKKEKLFKKKKKYLNVLKLKKDNLFYTLSYNYFMCLILSDWEKTESMSK